MLPRRVAMAALAGAALLTAPAQAEPLKELDFGIISTESAQNLKTIWEPFLADMERKLGMKVNAFFAPDYAGIIQGMRFNKVQLAWYGNKSAIEAVDRADGEVFAQTVAADGSPGYWSHVIVHRDSPLQNVDQLLKSGKDYTFGNGDPNSTSGFAVPGYYVFAQAGVDPKQHFKRMVTANHETNALAVANKQVDAATNNSENLQRLAKTHPEKRELIKVIWTSPLIPSDPIVWRKDLDAADKKKIKAFFLTYGVGDGPEAKKEQAILKGLQWAPFKESTNRQLVPIRQLDLFKERLKLEADGVISADEKKAKLAEIDRKLASLQKQLATN